MEVAGSGSKSKVFGVSCLVANSCATLCKPVDCNHQASLSMGFPREEYWSGLPFPFPGDLPHPGIEPTSPALADRFLTTELSGKPSLGFRLKLKPRVMFGKSYCLLESVGGGTHLTALRI